MAYDVKKIRTICFNIVAYYLITILLIIGGIAEWRAKNKFTSILTFLVAIFMLWEGTQNLIDHTNDNNPDQQNPAI